jgi:hypothetical protein
MTSTAGYECEEIVDSEKRALSLVSFIVGEKNYQGRLVIRLDAKHPYGVPPIPINVTSSICVSFNVEAGDEIEFNDSFLNSIQHINDSSSKLVQGYLYAHEGTYLSQICFECYLNDDDAFLNFAIWAPDKGGEDLCRHLVSKASELWSSFCEEQSLH